jgi:TetR/AcrR family transcriptional regulator, regulator of biofilm formation and stress response
MAEAESAPHPTYSEGRDALLDATARVVAREGFRGLTYRSVAREAGLTHGLVAYHFGSRDKLIHEATVKAAREAIAGSSLDPESGLLKDFASDLARLAAEVPDAQAFQFELALEARRRSELLPEIRALYEQYIGVVEQALERFGVESRPALARLVFAALDGLMLQQLIFERPGETDEAVALLQDILRGLAD